MIFLFLAVSTLVSAQEEEVVNTSESGGELQKQEASLQVSSKFDFVPGEQVLFFDDFSDVNTGDFPGRWNTNGSGEVVTLGGIPGKWLGMKTGGAFYPETRKVFPDNFTIEFDLVAAFESEPGCIDVAMYKSVPDEAIDGLVPGEGGGTVRLEGHTMSIFNWKEGNYAGIENFVNSEYYFEHKNKPIRISISVQKQRLRLYVDAAKIFDVPRFFQPDMLLDRVRIGLSSCEMEGYTPYICNFRIAVGAPDMRNKLITEGKMVTRGITFDSGSDRIKAESNGTLKEIAGILKDNPAVKVKIIGHTDSDGDDVSNMALSKKRAAAVKTALKDQYGIDGARMETDGKGESQAVSPNTTPEGKANNRRVELIKL